MADAGRCQHAMRIKIKRPPDSTGVSPGMSHAERAVRQNREGIFFRQNNKRLDRKNTPDPEFFSGDTMSEEMTLESLSLNDHPNSESLNGSDRSINATDLFEGDPHTPLTPPSCSSLHMSLHSLEEKAKSVPRKGRNKLNISFSSMSNFDARMEAYESKCGISFPILECSQSSDMSGVEDQRIGAPNMMASGRLFE